LTDVERWRLTLVDCTTFRERIVGFLGDEMAADERERHQAHLDGCHACADRLDAERSFERAIRARLRPATAPPGLETRVRAALRSEASGDRGARVPWWRNAWLATAAAAALAAVLFFVGPVPTFDGPAGSAAFRGRIVDHHCDLYGLTIEQQRDCLDDAHQNALRLDDGGYVLLAIDERDRHGSLLTRDARGLEVEVSGRFFRATRTIAVADVRGL
jgi:anti-sigma factor (TIGR02949 family)